MALTIHKIIISAITLFFINLDVFAQFDPCKFNFGADFDWLEGNKGSGVANDVNYVTKWIVDASFNGNAVYERFINYCVENKKTRFLLLYHRQSRCSG